MVRSGVGRRVAMGWMLVLSMAVGACASDDDTISPVVDRDIDACIESLDVLRGQEYMNALEMLGTVFGSRAVPRMSEALTEHPSPRVRAGCAQAMGRAQDPRAIPSLLSAAGTDENAGVRFTAGYALCRFRDPRGLPVLFKALRSEDVSHRREANLRLLELTGIDMGYEALADPAVREAAVERWEKWFDSKTSDEAAASLIPVRR